MFAIFFAEKIVKSRRVKLHTLMQTRTETFGCYDISENRHRNYILACIQMSVGQKTVDLYSEYTRVKTRKEQ